MLKETISEQIPVFSGADINQILELAQKSHEKYLIRANKKDRDKALIYYLEAIKINPAIAEVYYKIASLLWEKGEIDLHSAIKQCKKAVELAINFLLESSAFQNIMMYILWDNPIYDVNDQNDRNRFIDDKKSAN